MLDKYIEKNGKKLRYGFTTGTCAAAGAKAAATSIVMGKSITSVDIMTPKGWLINVPVKEIIREKDYAQYSVVKDGGDDPDMTNGMDILVKVKRNTGTQFKLLGGIGVGKITKPGLSVDVGEYAINPVPRKMIKENIVEIFESLYGVEVEISAPRGIEIAKKTFNPKLGIVGGISIIGTSGIVEPMSEDAIIDSIKLELSVLVNSGTTSVIFSPGNYGRDFCKSISLRTDKLVKTSNYIGIILEEAAKLGVKKILFVGHIGKMIKVAGGIFNTHSKIADGRMETLAANVACRVEDLKLINNIMNSNTTDEAIEYIKEAGQMDVFKDISEKISQKSSGKVFGEIEIGTIVFSNIHGLLGSDETGKKMMEEFKYE
jgi:cobalt-precorrin-5B (C1)-methyltransferase